MTQAERDGRKTGYEYGRAGEDKKLGLELNPYTAPFSRDQWIEGFTRGHEEGVERQREADQEKRLPLLWATHKSIQSGDVNASRCQIR